MKRPMLLVLTALAVVVAACSTAASPTPNPATPEPTPAASAALGDIVATADGAGTFTTLLAAAEAAGLVETLQGEGPYTVFAPTDDAFAALPEGTLDSLLADPEALKQILLYHVVSGSVMAADVVEDRQAGSLDSTIVECRGTATVTCIRAVASVARDAATTVIRANAQTTSSRRSIGRGALGFIESMPVRRRTTRLEQGLCQAAKTA